MTAAILGLHVCQKLQGLMALGPFSSCASGGIASDDITVPILDSASLPEASGPHAIGAPAQHALMVAL